MNFQFLTYVVLFVKIVIELLSMHFHTVSAAVGDCE